MSRSVRNQVILTAVVLVSIAAAMGVTIRSAALRLGHPVQAVIRRPNRGARIERARSAALPPLANLSPYATVTVSSVDASAEQSAEGVADGEVDTQAWVTQTQTEGAWIQLTWNTPATVSEVQIYGRAGFAEHVQGGTLIFDDGSTIPVDALPPNGTAWRATFPPKTVRQVMFRIDNAQGRSTGLAEIMVFGTLLP